MNKRKKTWVEPKTVPRVCAFCHEDFLAKASVVKRGKGIYCSKTCTASATVRKRSGHNRLFGEYPADILDDLVS